MIRLTDTMPGARYFMRVLMSDLEKWTAIGWTAHSREHVLSLSEKVVLIEYQTQSTDERCPTP